MQGELEVLKHLHHPNTLDIYDILHDQTSFYIVSEECMGGELTSRMKDQDLGEEQAAWIIF